MPEKRITSRPLAQALAIAIAATLAALLLYHANALNGIEGRLGDWRMRQLATPGAATDRIVTIIVDQTSLDQAESMFGLTWPWPREIYSHLLAFCQRGGAQAVVFDLVYTENSSYGVADDQTFAAALSNPPPAVIAVPLGLRMGTATNWPASIPPPIPQYSPLPGNLHCHWHQTTASFPVPELAAAATTLGSVVSRPDEDAVFRSIPPFAILDQTLVPNLGVAAYLAVHPEASPQFSPRAINISSHQIPLDATGEVRLRYRGPSQTHRAYNATAILQSELRLQEGATPSIAPESLQDAYVFVGLTAPGLMDLKPTPMGKTYPGVEVHATMLDNLLSNDFYRTPHPTTLALLALGLALLAATTIRLQQRVTVGALAIPLFLLLPIGLAYPIDTLGIWLPVAPLLAAGTLASLGAILTNYALEGRQKRFIKGAFKQYLSPDVIEKLLHDPDGLKLGGEEKTLSILFSDVQGFTSISEKLSPQALTSLLNEYLTAMTDIILASGGTIDKYEGDAIIAFWNAPLDQPDHATRAVQAALSCQSKLADMRPDLLHKYGSELYARIGINTGPVVVGNMGSALRFDYTFLGDAGNLAARLEGINKQFGTYCLISQATQAALPTQCQTRTIATVRVVGKSQPVQILEPFLPDTYPDDLLATFEKARRAFEQGDFPTAQRLFEQLAPQDPVAARYAKRAQASQQEPPRNWDGILQLTEK